MREVYRKRGAIELFSRLVRQIRYQFSARIFGSRVWFRARAFANSVRYETVPNPYKITYINPDSVQYFSARKNKSGKNIAHTRWKDIGRVADGDWDIRSISSEYAIKNSLLYESIENHFERGVPWEQTDYVATSREHLRQDCHQNTWRATVRSEEDLWERCEQLEKLYERIETSGYKSKQEVFDSQSNDPMGYYPRTYKYTLDEVMIDRGRDGEPLLVDGKHRLFLAKVCGIEEIPVLVVVRHREYVNSG
ncbi:hypothetical protein C490_09348 [Natronobacterium gregoryi SP2]|nr:hypothetical protein C490_09348 [Natronobacterium gregoryi SP2]